MSWRCSNPVFVPRLRAHARLHWFLIPGLHAGGWLATRTVKPVLSLGMQYFSYAAYVTGKRDICGALFLAEKKGARGDRCACVITALGRAAHGVDALAGFSFLRAI